MQRITISIDDELAAAFDGLIRERAYQSRSEALRDIIREVLERWAAETGDSAHSVANLSYVYDRRTRQVTQRLADLQHEHHDLVAACTLVRLDHDSTLETLVLNGPTADVRAFADKVRAERGVKFGALNLVAVQLGDDHEQGSGRHQHHHPGRHVSPVRK